MNKKPNLIIWIFIVCLATSCSEYEEVTVNNQFLHTISDSLLQAQHNRESWTKSPEDISKHFFPSVSDDAGAQKYSVIRSEISEKDCSVTVLAEGPIDDEVAGTKNTLYFSFDSIWRIRDLKMEIKRETR